MKFKVFAYQFDAGPFSSEEELLSDWRIGNCRRMLQWHFYVTHKLFFYPKQILCPAAYYETGSFVFGMDQEIDFGKLYPGDIIYAERIRSKDGASVDKNEKAFATLDDYIISLHTAIFTGKQGGEILHATSIEGKSCVWSLEKFIHFYRPITVKRLVT